jgi:uncharacterized protein YprB with RNaseH-like and TPR domain
MLAFDIETTGLLSDVDSITVASVYDPDRDIRKTFFFMRDGYDRQNNINEFLETLDAAESLCCFNGIRFDIPFIIAHFNVAPERYTPWFMKVSTISLPQSLDIVSEEDSFRH